MTNFNNKEQLRVYVQNCNGVRSKLMELRQNISVSNFDIISLMESRVQENQLFDSELCPTDSQYDVHRRDRNLDLSNKKGGGGVMVLTRKSLQVTRAFDIENLSNNEDLWLRIKLKDGNTLLYGTFYIRPQAAFAEYEEFFEKVIDIVNKTDNKTTVCIVGDANMPEIVWRSVDASMIPSEYEGRIAELLVHTMEICDLKQYNHVINANNRILDLCLLNAAVDQVSLQKPMEPLCRTESHHPHHYS